MRSDESTIVFLCDSLGEDEDEDESAEDESVDKSEAAEEGFGFFGEATCRLGRMYFSMAPNGTSTATYKMAESTKLMTIRAKNMFI